MKIFRSITMIINYKTFIVIALAVIATGTCDYYNYHADMPLTLIGIAIVFPIVFAINSAYIRRESALQNLADFKAHSIALVYAARDWGDESYSNLLIEIKNVLVNLYSALGDKLLNKTDHKKNSESEFEEPVSDGFSNLSKAIQKFRGLGLPAGEVSRVNQYLSKMLLDYENLKVIFNYRTPITLRAYSKIFLLVFPIVYAPYFAFVAQEYPVGLGYMLPVLFSLILVSLDNIQMHLENPFDQIGEDDIKLDQKEYKKLID